MGVKSLQCLTLLIRSKMAEDVALIFADPTYEDMESLVRDSCLVDLIENLLWKTGNKHLVESVVDVDNLEVKLETEQNSSKTDNEQPEELDDYPDDPEDILDHSDGDLSDHFHSKENFIENNFPENFKPKPKKRKLRKKSATESDSDEATSKSCPYCQKVFATLSQRKTHIKQICPEMTNVSCDQCHAKFENGRLLVQHISAEHEKGFKCDFCDYVAGIHRYKILHEKKLHLNLDCKVCYKLFDSVEEREDHECVRPDRFQCSQCDKNYKVKAELKKHIDIIHKGVKYPCPTCSDVLSSSQSLKRHIRTVHETLEKNFSCDICSKAFKDSDYLQRHMRTHEETTKSFVCQECGKFFKYQNTLKSHIRIMHDKIFKQTCEECGKCFPDMHKLKIHGEMVHMKGELFTCQLCGKEMLGTNRLRNHMMTHPKGQKFVSCEQCGKVVPETQLRTHIVQAHKMHSYKYPCDFCPKRLDTKAHIRAHIRKHTGARPFLCRGCGKYYPLLETAQKHTRIFHGGDYSLIFYDISKDVNNPYVAKVI